MDILTLGNLAAVMNHVNLPETEGFALLAGVEGAYGNTTFQGSRGFGDAFSLELESFFVFL
jgi:hypothetical protein